MKLISFYLPLSTFTYFFFSFYLYLVERKGKGVKSEHTVGEGLADAGDVFDGLRSLQCSKHSGGGSQHTCLGALPPCLAGSAGSSLLFFPNGDAKDGAQVGGSRHIGEQMSLILQEGCVAVWLGEGYAGVVDKILGCEAVGGIDNEVVGSDSLLRIDRAEHLVDRLDANVGIERLQLLACGKRLGSAEVWGGVENLPLQVAEAHLVAVHQCDGAHSGCRKIEGCRRTEAAHADD